MRRRRVNKSGGLAPKRVCAESVLIYVLVLPRTALRFVFRQITSVQSRRLSTYHEESDGEDDAGKAYNDSNNYSDDDGHIDTTASCGSPRS